MSDFGGKLRSARERRGISLRQIAASTKIATASLKALERNDISRLPGGIFSRAFVRSYAIEVGLDPDETVREFLERFDAEPPPSVAQVVIPEGESDFESQQRMAGVVLKLVVVSVIVLAVLLYFTMRRSGPPASDGAPLAASAQDGQDGQEARDENHEVANAVGTPAPPVPAVEPETPVPSLAGPGSQTAAGFRLDLHPSGDCWISLTVDGKPIFARVMEGGERLNYQVRTQAVIEIGDAGAFEYSLNGRPGRSLGQAGQVRSARITPTTLNEYFR